MATRKAANNTTISDGSTTSGSTTVGSAGANFTAGEVGAPISGNGIPAGDVIQSVAGDNSSVVVASSGVTRTVTDGVTNKTLTVHQHHRRVQEHHHQHLGRIVPGGACGAVHRRCRTDRRRRGVTGIGTGNGVGIPDGDTIATVTDGTHAVLTTAATSTNNGTVVGVNAIKLYLDGGQQTVSSATASFVTGDVGKVISGGNLASATTITGISGDGKSALLSSKAATGINTSANTWVIDNPAATATGSSLTLSIGTSTTSNGSTTLDHHERSVHQLRRWSDRVRCRDPGRHDPHGACRATPPPCRRRPPRRSRRR